MKKNVKNLSFVSAVLLVVIFVVKILDGEFEITDAEGEPGKKEIVNEKIVIDEQYGVVSRVVDGDTIVLEDGRKVRYIGIDTPESVHPTTPVECYALEAKLANEELVLNKRVRLEKDVTDTDRYHRLLRYVYIDDISVNEYLVENGFARALFYKPDTKYEEDIFALQVDAQKQLRGLWGACKDQ